MSMTLVNLDDDSLIHIFSFLTVDAILSMRQTCRRISGISRLRCIWQQAFLTQIIWRGLPYPHTPIVIMDASELEHCVLRSLHLERSWLNVSSKARKTTEFQAGHGTGVSSLRFLPGHGGRRLVTLSKGIWSIMTCWDIGRPPEPLKNVNQKILSEYTLKGAIFTEFVVNEDASSDGTIAVSVEQGGSHTIQVIHIGSQEGGNGELCHFKPIRTIKITGNFRPVALCGDLLALSDDATETQIIEWTSGGTSVLHTPPQIGYHSLQYNRCLQVTFVYHSILVVRARSIELFPEPQFSTIKENPSFYNPICQYSFGWIDGVAVRPQMFVPGPNVVTPPVPPLLILLRAENDDPWTSDAHKVDLYSILPNPSYTHSDPSLDVSIEQTRAPYLFPPVHSAVVPSARGFLRCTDIILGRHGTAVWIHPRPSRGVDLTTFDVHSSETHVPDRIHANESIAAGIFPGPLARGEESKPSRSARILWTQAKPESSWISIDYDEERGRIALGSTLGVVTLLEL